MEWLESLLQGRKNKHHPERSEEQSRLLLVAANAMETKKKILQITDRDIKIIRYLATHPAAVIIADKNVAQAFRKAKEAVKE